LQSSTAIIEKIRSDPKVPAPSQAVFKVLELTRNPQCRIQDVAAAISRDGGLTVSVFRQANSALYGFQTHTSSIAEACMRLGLKRVRSAVINQHVVDGLGRARPPGFDANRYWQSTFAISVAAHDLCAKLLRSAADEAATAGLLCDIGIGLLAFGVPAAYGPVLAQLKRPSSAPLHQIEQRTLGLSHAEVGAAVLTDWKLDAQIIEAVRRHHGEGSEPSDQDASKFARIVAAAVSLSEIALEGSEMDRVERLFSQMESLSPNPDALVAELLDGLVTHIQQSAESLSVELGSVDAMASNFEDMVRDLPDLSRQMTHQPMLKG